MHSFKIQSTKRREVIDISAQVEAIIAESRCANGIAMISALHSTCAISIGEVVQNVDDDLLAFINTAVPYLNFKHVHPADHPKDGTDAIIDGPPHPTSHILGILLGPSKSMGVVNGRLVRGEWQSIMLIELEGPRERNIAVQVIGEMEQTQNTPADEAANAVR
jgi:secondary thiamine-phosphate synthase enzyme